MKELIERNADKFRFVLVGGLNTLIDFALLFMLVSTGLGRIPSNLISTTVAFLFSFFANRSFTFRAGSGNIKRQFGLFFAVTLFGLWVIQPVIIELTIWFIKDLDLNESTNLFIAKLLATFATLVWNYLLYSKLVFKNKGEVK